MKRFKFFTLWLVFNFACANRSKETCNCYTLGTLASVEGESICDEKTFQCKCYPNITGLNCDHCEAGHYNIFSSQGCTSCSCSTIGTIDSQCDKSTGQCLCKDGYTGFRCDQCSIYMYKDENQCTACNCDINGSKNLQCNEVGQCLCEANTEGKHCSKCKENTYDISKACLPCGPCYDMVQNSITEFRKFLIKSESTLNESEKNLPSIIQDYEQFIDELKLLSDKTQKLKLQDDKPSLGKFEELFLELGELVNSFQENVISSIDTIKAGYNNEEINASLNDLQLILKDANNSLQSGQEALETAITRSLELHTHNETVTQIAKTAQTTLQQIQSTVEKFSEHSASINHTANETCKAAQTFQTNQNAIEIELNELNSSLHETRTGMVAMKNYITEFSFQTKETYRETIIHTTQANDITIPVQDEISIDTAVIKYDCFIIENIVQEVTGTAQEFREHVSSTKTYLEEVETKQKSFDNHMFVVEGYDSKASSAIQFTNELFFNSQADLQNLKDYEKLVLLIKELLKDVPNIQEKINAVRSHSTEAKQIFEELIDVIKANENLKLKTDGLLKIMDGNHHLMLSNINLVEEIEEEERDISVELEKFHGELKNIKYNLDKVKKIETGTETKIKQVEEYLLLLNTIPLTDEQLNTAKNEIQLLENMYGDVNYLKIETNKLAKEIANVKEILENLPIDDKTLCEAPESEPKIGSK